ncbi:ABC transporter ATP-binding protein [Corynebacterium suedekumii]|uniref:ABC transporter ATP-binding protein n=1 Tax=Corynebacterium suedekumii TaxID=3049801 RepID=A0ABY8VM75_9CORY|nr:ABC transporter ATP-binding protein [Corynebacterium suedekumii]WIM70751.1 ABC transporter ATP-binding protein [Corynebacterium suedekumii]WIM71814.1 ABC transporter ATP-binding protein [Corynebacterium suedekumii]
MNNSQPAITVTDLTRTYGAEKKDQAFTAVNGIGFDVHHGEVFGLLGTNGAGKTSTLELIEGLSSPDGGEIRVLGLDPVADRQQLRPELGIMLQSGGLPSQLTVAETMRMWAGTCSTPRPIDEVLADVDLTHRADVKVGALSGGEQRRLDLACALVGDPSIIILDEPTTGLDPESRRNVWDLLTGLKERGTTMVLTTHYLEEADHLCDRIAIMHEGEIRLAGTPTELVAEVAAEITVTLPAGHPPLPELPGTQITRAGHDYTIATNHLAEDTLAVLDWAAHHRIAPAGFAARPATLESVFLSIAGHEHATV